MTKFTIEITGPFDRDTIIHIMERATFGIDEELWVESDCLRPYSIFTTDENANEISFFEFDPEE